MYLKELTIRNFKSFGDEPVTIEFSAISLLFGKNGSGKSSVMQALAYLYEVFINGLLDPVNLTICGNKHVGGFKNLIHNKDLNREMEFKITLVGQTTLSDEYWNNFAWIAEFYHLNIYSGPLISDSPDAIGQMSFTLKVSHDFTLNKPIAKHASVEINGIKIYDLELVNFREESARLGTSDDDAVIKNFNFKHPLLTPNINTLEFFAIEFLNDLAEERKLDLNSDEKKVEHLKLNNHFEMLSGKIFPDKTQIGIFLTGPSEFVFGQYSAEQDMFVNFDNISTSAESKLQDYHGNDRLPIAIEKVFYLYYSFPFRKIQEMFGKVLQIGPLRINPDRYFRPHKPILKSDWYDGSAAWSKLFESNDLLAKTNKLMAEEVKLEFAAVVSTDEVPLLHLLNDELKIAPADTGLGVSQVFPIVVSGVCGSLNLVEQPELHLHPEVQLNIADMFISTAVRPHESIDEEAKNTNLIRSIRESLNSGNRNLNFMYKDCGLDEATIEFIIKSETFDKQWIVETHSEHIILRLLRRIRESDFNHFYKGRKVEPNCISVNVIELRNGHSTVSSLEVSRDGDFMVAWPNGFFDERDNELF